MLQLAFKGETEMSTQTDFKVWFENLDIDGDIEEIHSLYHAVKDNDSAYGYEIDWNGERMFVSSSNADETLLLTEKSRGAFIKYLDSRSESEVDIERDFQRAMQKDDWLYPAQSWFRISAQQGEQINALFLIRQTRRPLSLEQIGHIALAIF